MVRPLPFCRIASSYMITKRNVIRLIAVVAFSIFAVTMTFARLGETEPELVKRFGAPVLRETHMVAFQGRTYVLGPALVFKTQDWRITCDLVDGRCARIHYTKVGDWTDEQFETVRNANAQGLKWRETSKPELGKLYREWRREDGAVAVWQMGVEMKITVPAYERAKATAEATAKAQAGKPATI